MIVIITSYAFCSDQRLEILYDCIWKKNQTILLATASANAIGLDNPWFFSDFTKHHKSSVEGWRLHGTLIEMLNEKLLTATPVDTLELPVVVEWVFVTPMQDTRGSVPALAQHSLWTSSGSPGHLQALAHLREKPKSLILALGKGQNLLNISGSFDLQHLIQTTTQWPNATVSPKPYYLFPEPVQPKVTKRFQLILKLYTTTDVILMLSNFNLRRETETGAYLNETALPQYMYSLHCPSYSLTRFRQQWSTAHPGNAELFSSESDKLYCDSCWSSFPNREGESSQAEERRKGRSPRSLCF